MGGGDLNMKKSWHPVLLVNQERVWKAEKSANEEKKKLAQLRKEQEEERQLAELQRMQEQATGKKRVDRLDWMYAAPTSEGSALGGARIGEKDMEDYLLGNKRVDQVLAAGERNVGNQDKDFIAVQNANTARDTASKIREDPMFLIKKQELARMEALKNDPAIRKKLKELARLKENGETKEERKAKRRAEKEERRKDRREHRHERTRGYREESYGRSRTRSRSRSRSYSPRRDRDRDHDARGRRNGDRDPRDGGRDRSREYRRDDERRIPPPRRYSNDRGDSRPEHHSNGHSNGNGYGHGHGPSNGNGHSQYSSSSNGNGRAQGSLPPPPPPPNHNRSARPSAMDLADKPATNPSSSLDDMRAARLAAMQSSAVDLQSSRDMSLAHRAQKDKMEDEQEARMRKKYGKEEVHTGFFKQQTEMSLSEGLARRGGKGLQRDI